jgi:hypothetical protein
MNFMSTNRISAELTAQTRDEILRDLENIKAKLPFLIDLSADEKQSMAKFGDKSRAFITKALELANLNKGAIPADLDLNEMKKDVELMLSLYPVLKSMDILYEKINDTYFAAGSEAYSAGLHIYLYLKAANIATGGLDDVLDDLGKRFVRKASKNKANLPK